MSLFTKHNPQTAPNEAAMVLGAAKEKYGFVPNLAAYVAESPIVLASVLQLSEQFENSSFSAQEQQLILVTVSTLNGCDYCKVAHTALGKKVGIDTDTLRALVDGQAVENPRLEALRRFTSAVVEEKGWVDEPKLKAFLDEGFTRAQVFELVLGVGLKTITNFCNHIAGAEPNEEFLLMAGDVLDQAVVV